MEFSSDTLALIFIIAFVILVLVGIVYAIVSKNMRGGGSFNSVTIFGATSQFQTMDQKAATEHVLDVQSDKKMKEEESGDPEEK